MALQKGQRLREVGQFEVAEVGQIKSAGDNGLRILPWPRSCAAEQMGANDLSKPPLLRGSA
ncbi:hypothetical protein XcvCFBP7113P_01710 [Xanthomonas citri pv. vignicola]|nr:hypothetical protein XcvCFBP7113P_01710 [Xanthomonas citri pv. vignicola]